MNYLKWFFPELIKIILNVAIVAKNERQFGTDKGYWNKSEELSVISLLPHTLLWDLMNMLIERIELDYFWNSL